MLVPFAELPTTARVWIYQTNRSLTNEEENHVRKFLPSNIEQWTAHGTDLQASFEMFHNRFVVVALNETFHAASGCSIDASTRWFKTLGEQLSVDFFDRSQAYLNENTIQTFSIFETKKAVEKGILQPETMVFVPQVSNLEEFLTRWCRPAKETTFKRFFA